MSYADHAVFNTSLVLAGRSASPMPRAVVVSGCKHGRLRVGVLECWSVERGLRKYEPAHTI